MARVEVSRGDEAICSWIGTSRGFGCFAPSTRLLTASGKKVIVGEVIEAGSVKDHAFEACVPTESLEVWSASSVWRALSAVATACGSDAIHVSSRNNGADGLIIHRDTLGELPSLISSIEAVAKLRIDADGEYIFDRREQPFLVWFLSMLQARDTKYRLSYDSIQHSSQIALTLLEGHPPLDLRGTSAFSSPDFADTYKVAWSESGWNPISDGFVLAS